MKRLWILLSIAALACACSKNEPGGGGGDTPQPEESLEAVDLQLSVKWGSINIKQNGQTCYYAWGETKTKATGNIFDYVYWPGKDCLKYNNDPDFPGRYDKKTVLETADDAARQALGGGWRMPTAAEWKELVNGCTWTWTTGSNPGYKITSKYNGNSIFLPVEGFVYESDPVNKGTYGYYWSSSYSEESAVNASAMLIGKSVKNSSASIPRMYGLAIRPVCK